MRFKNILLVSMLAIAVIAGCGVPNADAAPTRKESDIVYPHLPSFQPYPGGPESFPRTRVVMNIEVRDNDAIVARASEGTITEEGGLATLRADDAYITGAICRNRSYRVTYSDRTMLQVSKIMNAVRSVNQDQDVTYASIELSTRREVQRRPIHPYHPNPVMPWEPGQPYAPMFPRPWPGYGDLPMG